MCGESCIDPKDFDIFKVLEWNLTKSTIDHPCASFGYDNYKETETHGIWPI